jgi:uncharacterized Zn finger protein
MTNINEFKGKNNLKCPNCNEEFKLDIYLEDIEVNWIRTCNNCGMLYKFTIKITEVECFKQ